MMINGCCGEMLCDMYACKYVNLVRMFYVH